MSSTTPTNRIKENNQVCRWSFIRQKKLSFVQQTFYKETGKPFWVKIHLAMHHAGKVETLHNLLSAHAVLVVVLVSTVLQVSSSEELGSQPLGVLGQTVDDRESRLIPLANVLDSLNDVDEVYDDEINDEPEKRAWNSGFTGGVGKRAWNSGFNGGVGKRGWNSGFVGGVGKRAWNSGFAGGVGKRAWNSGFTGGVGKRAWNSGFSGGVGKRAWNSGFTGGVGKRAWNSGFTGGVGKRAWNSGFTGGVGKRAWNAGFNGAVGKRAWNSGFAGGVGKRAWNSGFAGSVGKRDDSNDAGEDVESSAINEVKGY